MIKILEQGIYPQDKPSKTEGRINFYDGADWESVPVGELEDGDHWMILTEPEKSIEEMTTDELIEKWVAKFPDEAISFRPEFGTYREALIKSLK